MKKSGLIVLALTLAFVLLGCSGQLVASTAPIGDTILSSDAAHTQGPENVAGYAEDEILQAEDSYSVQALSVSKDGQAYYGQVYVPDTHLEKYPLVIIGHGYGSTADGTAPVAQRFAQAGIAACVFDFRGGSMYGRSGGDTTQMSVLTEEDDMQLVLDALVENSLFDTHNVFLMGQSQGGFVAALLAAKIPNAIRGLILEYPALVIPEDARSRYPSLAATPETYELMGMRIGRKYSADVWDMDAIKAVQGYPGPVLFIHGDQDELVPISYSQRAAEAYENAKLITIPGAGHGFLGADFTVATNDAISFVKEHLAAI